MIVIKIMERDMIVTTTARVTSGSVNLPVKFHFKGDEWDDLVKTAVFIGSGQERDVALITDECAVPADVLAEAGGDLKIGVYGRLANGATVIPTIWGRVQYIYEGTEMSEPSPHDPEPDWTAQVQQAAATALTKATAVEEAAARGDFDGVSPEVTISSATHGHSVTITDRDHPEGQSFDVLDGASAYEQAVAGGYEGTEAQFNAELAAFKDLSEQAASSATAAASSATAAAGSATAAAGSATDAAGSATQAASSETAAAGSASNAASSATSASGSATAAASSATAAAGSASDAATAKTAAEAAQTAAAASAADASDSADSAASSATAASGSATAAANSATAAAASATAAGNAQTAAEAAQTAAVAAKTATESARDTAISTLQTEGAAQKTAIQQKGAEVIASIPADYSDLSDDVADLKSVLNGELYETVVNLGTLIKNEYVTATGSVAPYGGWDRTDYIDVTDIVSITYNHASNYCAAYKDDYSFNGQLKLINGIAYLIPAGTKYIMISDTATNMSTATVTALKQTTIIKLTNSVESMETAVNTISSINATNIYNKSYVVGSTGAISTSLGWIASRFIELNFTPFSSITVSGSFETKAGCAFYDEDYNYIPNSGIDGNNISQYSYSGNPGNYCTVTCAIPNNAKYIRISGKASYISETQPICVTGNTFSGTYPEINKNAAKIKVLEALVSTAISESKVLVIGDSISTDAYGSYPKWVTDLINTGFLPSDTTNSSQHATGFVARYNNEANDFITRLKAIQNPTQYNLVVVFGGINDYIQNIPMGSESGTDYTVSFKPAVNEFFTYLIQNFTQARLCVLLPLRTYATWKNSVGEYQQAYGDYIKQVAKSYCLPVLNLTEDSGFCPYISTFSDMWTLVQQGYQSGDGVHPNQEYERRFLAPMIKHFLQGLM